MLWMCFATLVRPLMRLWATYEERYWRDLPRPRDSTNLHAQGVKPDRILLIGNAASVGWGVVSHEIALAGHLVRQIAAATGHGADLDVIASAGMTAKSTLEKLHDVRLIRYDIIILTVGLTEAFRLELPRTWEADLVRLSDYVQGQNVTNQRILVAAVPPMGSIARFPSPVLALAARAANLLNARTRALAERDDNVLVYLPFSPLDTDDGDRFGSRSTYETLARLMTPAVTAILGEIDDGVAPFEPDQEQARQDALEALHILDTGPDARFQRITATARSLFHCEVAAVTFIDRDRQWNKATVGMPGGEVPRSESICNHTIRRPEAFVIEDVADDARFNHHRLGAAGPPVRFYAGYPIESPDGHRIGALCLLDSRSRTFSAEDKTLLRQLAHQVQQLLWETASEPDAVTGPGR